MAVLPHDANAVGYFYSFSIIDRTSVSFFFCFSNSLLFVRYKTLAELVIAIETLNGQQINGITIDVSPARDRMTRSTSFGASDWLKLRHAVDENSIQHLYSSLQQPLYRAPVQQGLLPTPTLPLRTHLLQYEYPPTVTAKPVIQQRDPSQDGINVTKEQLATGVNQEIGASCNKGTIKVQYFCFCQSLIN